MFKNKYCDFFLLVELKLNKVKLHNYNNTIFILTVLAKRIHMKAVLRVKKIKYIGLHKNKLHENKTELLIIAIPYLFQISKTKRKAIKYPISEMHRYLVVNKGLKFTVASVINERENMKIIVR